MSIYKLVMFFQIWPNAKYANFIVDVCEIIPIHGHMSMKFFFLSWFDIPDVLHLYFM